MRLVSQPAFAAVALSLAALGVVVALVVSPPALVWRRLAPLGWAEHELGAAPGVEPPRYASCLGTPRLTEAWQLVARAPDAAARFRRVLATGSRAGRLYALAGLRAADPRAFGAALPAALADTAPMPWRGPAGPWGERHAAAVAREIAGGGVTAALAAAPRVRPTCIG